MRRHSLALDSFYRPATHTDMQTASPDRSPDNAWTTRNGIALAKGLHSTRGFWGARDRKGADCRQPASQQTGIQAATSNCRIDGHTDNGTDFRRDGRIEDGDTAATQTAMQAATQTAMQTATQTAMQTATQTAMQTATQTAMQTATQTATWTATQTAMQTATSDSHMDSNMDSDADSHVRQQHGQQHGQRCRQPHQTATWTVTV